MSLHDDVTFKDFRRAGTQNISLRILVVGQITPINSKPNLPASCPTPTQHRSRLVTKLKEFLSQKLHQVQKENHYPRNDSLDKESVYNDNVHTWLLALYLSS